MAHPEVNESMELRSPFGFLAFHAGLEGGTLEVAREAARRSGSSLYVVTQPPEQRWHVPSSLVDPAQSPTLRAFLDHIQVAVAVHGYGRIGRAHDILVGGGNRALAGLVAAELRRLADGFVVIDVLADIPVSLRGVHPDNPVNRARGGGAQIELPPAARGATHSSPGPSVPAPGVVEALASAAQLWSDQPG